MWKPNGRLGLALLLIQGCSGGDDGGGSEGGTNTASGTDTTSDSASASASGTTSASDSATTTGTDGSGTASSSGPGTGSSSATETGTSGTGGTSASGGTSGTGSTSGTGASSGSGSSGSGGSGSTGGIAGTDIDVVITSDNAYGFGYGTLTALANYWGGVENTTAGQIFNCNGGPETYMIPASEAENATHLYIITWADSAVTQGVIGRFRRTGGVGGFGEAVLTGDAGWEVCATGMNFSPGSGGPSQILIDQMLVACNDSTLDAQTSSVTWVDEVGTVNGALAVGEDNTTPYNGGPTLGNEFPITCQNVMPMEAKWMWFNWDPANITWPNQSPFMWPGGGGNPDHQFLIFRLAADLLPPPQ